MAGTDRTQAQRTGGPAIILIEPQLGENIGSTARAMLNCGLTDLRLVSPRDGWPNPAAVPNAAGADAVLEGARVFDSTASAIADLSRVYATTARPRDLIKPVATARAAAAEMRGAMAAGQPCGVLFGPERSGMTNDDVALADTVITIPLNPAFSSLNLAQAVLLVAYEWTAASDTTTPPREIAYGATHRADSAAMLRFFEHLEQELDAAGFFRVRDKRPGMIRNLRSLFHRTEPSEAEVRTLHGIVTALSGRRLGGRPRRRSGGVV